jgi:predicted AlkP superfamily phosphohydrolase/phosphomutase
MRGDGAARPVLVVGLDMGDSRLIAHWAGQGQLPHLAALRTRGTWLDLESTAAILHTSAWPTFATGSSPGRHGVYYPYQPRPGHQQAQFISPDQYGTPTFWALADQARRRCLIYDVPETFPDPGFGGRAIFDWGTWAHYGARMAQPSALLAELKSRFGDYPLGLEAKRLGLGRPDRSDLEKRLIRSVAYKRDTAVWLLGVASWDLAVIGFCELHPAGHYLWPADAEVTAQANGTAFEPLRNVYVAIDQAIGTLIEEVSDEVIAVVVSGDGVQPNHCGWHLMPEVLRRLGHIRSPSASGDGEAAARGSLVGRIKQMVPPRARRLIADNLPWWLRDRLGAHLQSADIDWARTRAFALPTDLEGCIRINLKGREPQGIVDPGSPHFDLCEQIRDELLELTNPATGAAAVRQVHLRPQVFPGELGDHLPDIIVTWNDEAPINGLTSARIGLVEEVSPDPRTGTHSSSGFLLAAGPGVAAGGRGQGHLLDVAPTVFQLLGLEPGRNTFEGRPLRALTGGECSTPVPAHSLET